MAKVFTQEEREKIKGQVVELVRLSGRETLRQLEAKTGATRYLMSVLARELVASGDVYCCLVCGEFVKRNWHGESPCAEGQSATGVLSPTLILSVRVQVLILNSPGGTRHHAMAHSATLQPLSGGAVYIDFVRCE